MNDAGGLGRRVGPLAVLAAGAALPAVVLALRAGRPGLAVGVAVVSAAALAWGVRAQRERARRVGRLTAVAEAVARGEEPRAFAATRSDDLGRLERAFATMERRVRDHIDTLTAERNTTAAILASMVEGVVAVDREERVVHVNHAARRILGMGADRVVGRRLWELTRVREAAEAVRVALRGERTHLAEARLALPDGEQVVQLVASPLRGDAAAEGAVLVMHDVTELRRLEAVRRDFVANVSHELKTPLTSIRGYVETILDDPGMDDATRQRFLERIREQSDRLGRLVADLMTISRLESDGEVLQIEPLDLRAVVRASVDGQRDDARARSLTLEVHVPDEAVPVRGDAEALRELVDNLVSNAIRYTPEGGRVEVRVRTRSDAAVVEVSDTGIGIAPEDQGRVFERFYRADRARSRQAGGTGLGLAIVKHVALAHGGNVSLRSEPGRGSTFRVDLPLAGPSSATGPFTES